MTDATLFYGVLVPVTVIGGFLRGFAGFGGPLFMLPILSFFLSPPVAVGVMMWIDIFSNVHLIPNARADSSRAVVIPLLAGTAMAMPVGAHVLLSVEPVLMKKIICGSILLMALVLLTGWRFRDALGASGYIGIGALSGFVMGSTAIAAVTALFLDAGHRSAAQNRANFIIWAFLATILLIALLTWRGALAAGDKVATLVLTPIYLASVIFGARTHRVASDAAVRRTVLGLVIVTAIVGLVL
ncbi:MAG: sulfite exporter TauE/SafE family protein [Acidimicrobiia bacterium]|nr:sulfite exporter TauE/SafE family protein [Acidimicrobiia bacterium]